MASHNTAERRSYIIQVLQDQGHASVSALSDKLGVSEVTIRKDIHFLEQRNLLIRTHVVAVMGNCCVSYQPFEEHITRSAEEESRSGAASAGKVADGETLILDSGSTTLQI